MLQQRCYMYFAAAKVLYVFCCSKDLTNMINVITLLWIVYIDSDWEKCAQYKSKHFSRQCLPVLVICSELLLKIQNFSISIAVLKNWNFQFANEKQARDDLLSSVIWKMTKSFKIRNSKIKQNGNRAQNDPETSIRAK